MKTARFYLKLTPDELLEYYKGHKLYVRVMTYGGYSIQFRVEHLRRWVQRDGIDGDFEIIFDDFNNFQQLNQVGKRPNGAAQESKNSDPHHSGKRPRRGFTTSV